MNPANTRSSCCDPAWPSADTLSSPARAVRPGICHPIIRCSGRDGACHVACCVPGVDLPSLHRPAGGRDTAHRGSSGMWMRHSMLGPSALADASALSITALPLTGLTGSFSPPAPPCCQPGPPPKCVTLHKRLVHARLAPYRCGRGEPSLGADVAVPGPAPARCSAAGAGVRPVSPGADVRTSAAAAA